MKEKLAYIALDYEQEKMAINKQVYGTMNTWAMINEGKRNSILVGGVSGAGITETTKMLMRYLAHLGGRSGVEGRERNYHCFYLHCAAPPEDIEKFKLESPQSYHYLNQSKSYELEGVSDAHEYLATRRAIDIVGISEEEQDAIFRVVAAILHLGNVEFAKGKDIDSSVLKD